MKNQKTNKKKWGRIVHLGSIGVKFGGGINNLPYSLSKFNLEFFPNYTKKWIKHNVFINTIRVGETNTKLHKNLPSKNIKKRTELIPAKRMANQGEIAEFVCYIGSEKNTYISHQVLPISGGE
jgi:NAD(P)-dependent dehydrogenase (short-subunit alcohol dehydrogenase family)